MNMWNYHLDSILVFILFILNNWSSKFSTRFSVQILHKFHLQDIFVPLLFELPLCYLNLKQKLDNSFRPPITIRFQFILCSENLCPSFWSDIFRSCTEVKTALGIVSGRDCSKRISYFWSFVFGQMEVLILCDWLRVALWRILV